MTTTEHQTLHVGDIILLQHGPFESDWKVERIINAGAVLTWAGTVEFVGHGTRLSSPGGDPLTEHEDESFLGRAHWPAAQVIRVATQ